VRSGACGRLQKQGFDTMRNTLKRIWCFGLVALSITASPPVAVTPADTAYVFGESSRGGTGKFYMGREIARVMGHCGADWLERPNREREEAPDVLVRHLGLSSTDVVADIGAGTGYFTFRLSPLVPEGAVFAVDVQEEMLEDIRGKMRRAGVDNVIPVLGEVDDPRLPRGSVDMVLLVDAYHEFSHPREMMRAVYTALRPGGRVILVEYRLEDPEVPIKPIHRMSQEQARAEMEASGLEWVETKDVLPRQHFMVFEKPRMGD
jgi:ubiquinone/menaquinone biosynthesis C-methylase UbiE